MNYSLCNNLAIPLPPTASASCGVASTVANFSTILKTCCNNGPIANYSQSPSRGGDPNGPTYCFQYCNITDPNLSYLDVERCIMGNITLNQNLSAIGQPQALDVFCIPAANGTLTVSTGSKTIVGGMSRVVWAILGIGLVGAVFSGL